MQMFLQHYINENFEKSINALDMQRTWNNWVQDNAAKENVNNILAMIEWSEWMYRSALPTVYLDFYTKEANES